MGKDVIGYDITIGCKDSPEHFQSIAKVLKEVFKKWAFQKERGDGGYLHWQVRGHLYKPKTLPSVIKEFAPMTWGGHWSVTSSEVHKQSSFNYVLKADTRIVGPWTDKDEDFGEPPPITRQLQTFMELPLYPWQQKIIEEAQMYDDRLIKVILDEHGNNGKSILSELMEYKGIAFEIPPMNCMEDIMQCCMGIKPQKCYLVDMPRGMKKDKLAGFYSGLESLKNGVMYDKRYGFKKRRIDRPQIIVFTNAQPDWTLMSPDRWTVFRITEDKNLVPEEIITSFEQLRSNSEIRSDQTR